MAEHAENPDQQCHDNSGTKYAAKAKENTTEKIKSVNREAISIEIIKEIFKHRFAGTALIIALNRTDNAFRKWRAGGLAHVTRRQIRTCL